MTHIAEEGRLRAIELGQGLRPLAFFSVRLGIDDRASDVARDEIEERTIGRIEYAARAHSDDEHRGETSGSRAQDRQHDRLPRRFLPGAAKKFRADRSEISDLAWL